MGEEKKVKVEGQGKGLHWKRIRQQQQQRAGAKKTEAFKAPTRCGSI
jgi:hypothetical protein